jgi:hypothetical protein
MSTFDPSERSRRVLDWNRRHLVAAAPLSLSDVAECFAPEFTIRANGRTHPADLVAYHAFLDEFRATIQTIDYDVHETVAEGSRVLLALTAHITRVQGYQDRFEAMLLLNFDAQGLVKLWHEVYVST